MSEKGPPEGRALASIVVQGQFRAKLLTLNWANVKNAAYYKVGIWKGGFIGPIYGTTKVVASTYSAATSKVPVSAAGVRIVVDAFSSSGKKIAGSEAIVRLKTSGSRVSTSKRSAAIAKIKSCAKAGEVAAVGTGVGLSVVAAVGLWIPGADIVTSGGFVLAVAGAGAGGFVTCAVIP